MSASVKPGDFIEARRRLEAKKKASGERVVTAEVAVELIHDGAHVAIGGCLFSRTPMALVHEILRQKRRDLTISRNLLCFEAELFLVAGVTTRLVSSWQGIGLPWGLSKILREYVESGKAYFEEWSHLGIGLRYRAAAMGVPFLPTLTMLGSDLMDVGSARTMTDPFTGETVCAVPALFPDVAILHVHRADPFGNCQIDGYAHMDADIARAASTVLVTAEEIIDNEDVRRHPDRTVIPSIAVDAVVEAPFGAYPGECYGRYETDFEHLDAYVSGINARGVAGVHEYLQRYVYGVGDHGEYMRLIDPGTLGRLRQASSELVGSP